jgi:predicted DNA-binding protein YlxM (UPF0122 family)
VYITQTSRNSVDALAKQTFGKTFTEVDASLTKTIIFLFSEIKISMEEIADKIGVDVKTVYNVLKKQKLIKK